MEGVEDPVALAEEWEQRHDETTGQVYYVNLHTGESSWDPPAGHSANSNVPPAHQWTEAADETGRVYYMNLATMETTWDPPPGFYSTAPENSALRPSTAEQMDELNALLSGGDGDDDEGEDLQDGNPEGSSVPSEIAPAIIEEPVPNETTAALPAEDGSEWMMFLNEADGLPYYYNHITGECVWEPPGAFLEYHAQLGDGELMRNIDDVENNQAGEDTSNPRQPTPAVALVPQTPSTPIQITPEFEEKVRRAIETVSKTPVGSSRLLLVRTPTVKSLDSSRPASRPTSSSGASARQRVITSRAKTDEEEQSPKDVDTMPTNEQGHSLDSLVQETDEIFEPPVGLTFEPLDFLPTDEDIELLQREAMMLDLERDEMALTIQCMARCFLARARVARKRVEKQQTAEHDGATGKQIVDSHVEEGNGNQADQSSEEQQIGNLTVGVSEEQVAESPPSEEASPASETTYLVEPLERSSEENVERGAIPGFEVEETNDCPPLVQKVEEFGGGADQTCEEIPRAEVEQSQAKESKPTMSQAETEERVLDVYPGGIDASLSPASPIDRTSPRDVIETVPVCDNPVATEEEGPNMTDPHDHDVTSTPETVDDRLSSGSAIEHQATEENDATTDLSDMLAEPMETQPEPILGSQEMQEPDMHESMATPLEVPQERPVADATAHETLSLKPTSGEISTEVPTPSTRPSTQQKRSNQRAEERVASRSARAQDVKQAEVDKSSGRLAILNIASFFPPNQHHDRQTSKQPVPSKPGSVVSAALTGGITRKIISVNNQSDTRSTSTEKTTEEREQEQALRAKAMKERRDLAKAQWHEEVKQCRGILAASAQQFSQKEQELIAVEAARQTLTEDARTEWLREESPKKPVGATSKETSLSLWEYTRGDGTYEGAKARMHAATEPQSFVRSMMRERLAVINRIIERDKLSHDCSDSTKAYWQQLAGRFPPSFEEGDTIDDPYWSKLHAKLVAIVTTSRDVAHELTRHRTDSFDAVLHAAAWRGHHEFVAFLILDLQADVNAIDSTLTRTTPLHEACRGGHVTVVDILLSHGAFLDAVDIHGETPLHAACRLGWTEVVHRLIEAGEAQDDCDRLNPASLTEPEAPRARVLRQLSWIECFHLRNGKHRRAMDIASLPSLIEFLARRARH